MIPAVPSYLGRNFDDAPPGHRFGLYFPIWKETTWEMEGKEKSKALKQVLAVPVESRKQIAALRERQQALIAVMSDDARLNIEAIATAPMATGLGMEHPMENGFAFLNPYGLAYLPGSSIKGVLRRAAEELLKENEAGWTNETVSILFGYQDSDNPRRGALTFWDSIPEIAGDAMGMDVMTPHYSDYYQGKSTPHDAGQPIPIVFMVIPAGSNFRFHVTANTGRLKGINNWKTMMQAVFERAFAWLGFGAKTAVGYGALRKLDEDEIAKIYEEQKASALKCEWVDNTISELVKQHHSSEDVILGGPRLAEAWHAVIDPDLRRRSLDDIRSRWQAKGWWNDGRPSKGRKKAKEIYEQKS